MRILQPADCELRKILQSQKIRPDQEYIPSRYVLPFTHKGRSFLFHTLTRELLEAELPERRIPSQDSDLLIEHWFLVPEGSDELAFYRDISSRMRSRRKTKMHRLYTIHPTTECNARCAYCYQNGIKRLTMTKDVVRHTLRYILDTQTENRVKLKWVGGEPLLCPEIIDRICSGLREAGIEYTSSMISNGSLITPEIVRKMREDWNLCRIQISMDGAEADYTARKQYKSLPDAYRIVLEGINLLAESGIQVIVRCSVDKENWNRIGMFLNDMKTAIKDKTNVRIYFAPLFQVRCGPEDLALWEKVFAAGAAIEEAGFCVKPSLFSASRFRIFHCSADGGNVTIHSDGGLYACSCLAKASRFGSVLCGVTDEEARNAFCRTDRIRNQCGTCPFLPECTAFDHCPYTDTHCREVRKMDDLAVLKRLIDKATETSFSDDPKH